MFNPIGESIYISTYKKNSIAPLDLTAHMPVFLSLHISEEFNDSYNQTVIELCEKLKENETSVIADVSKKTLQQFKETDMLALAKRLHLWAIRIDYGFSMEEIKEIVKEIPVVLNASTTALKDIQELKTLMKTFST